MYAQGVLSAQPAMASGAVRIGRRSGQKAVGVNSFAGNTRSLKARATMGRRVAAPMKLDIRAEKVVGIDLGTTNSAVSHRRTHTDQSPFRPGGNLSAFFHFLFYSCGFFLETEKMCCSVCGRVAFVFSMYAGWGRFSSQFPEGLRV